MSTRTARFYPGLTAALFLAPALATAQVPTRANTGIVREMGAPRNTATLEAVPVEPAPAPRAGPPPQGVGIDASGTYGVIAKVVWSPTPNAVSYVVQRRLLEDSVCCNVTSPPLTTTSWTDTGLLKKGNYMFTVLANYADGSVGSSGMGTGAPGVVNPALTATDLSPGRVRLNWDNNIPGTSLFMVGGPGLGTGTTRSSGPVDTGLLPPGTHTWRAASIYAQGLGILSPASEWSTVTHTVSYGSGRYRISLEGFKAINVTAEDPFRHDGRGDEVFITTQVSEHQRNGGVVSTRMARTPTFGDRQNFPERVQAGSASSTGGVMPNDRYPVEAQLISQLQPATGSNLPFLLWEGQLSEIDGAVILSPAIWESDGGDELVPSFANFQAEMAADVAWRLGDWVPNSYGRPILDTWNPRQSCAYGALKTSKGLFKPAISGWRDEPMDMNADRSYCPTYVAINYKMARGMTSVNPATVVEIPYQNKTTGWQYTLYVRVEKVEAPAQMKLMPRRR